MPYRCMLQDDSFCSCLLLQQHQTSRTERRQFGYRSLQDLLEACLVLSLGDESCQISKKKINRAVQSLLEHCPAPTVCCLVTIHFKGSSLVRVDGVNAAVSKTSFVQLSAVSVYWKTMSSEAF